MRYSPSYAMNKQRDKGQGTRDKTGQDRTRQGKTGQDRAGKLLRLGQFGHGHKKAPQGLAYGAMITV